VLLNLGDARRRCDLARIDAARGEVVVATGERRGAVPLDDLTLEPLEGLALQL
jgi:hypothetical protein